MTRDDSQSFLAFSEEHRGLHGIPVFYRMHCFNGTIQSEVSTTLKLSPRLSFIPIQLQVYILELLHLYFLKQQLRLDSKRNRRRRVKIITKHCLNCLFAPSVKRYSRNRIASKYHYHASAYSLQTVCCRFIYLHKENANADDTDNSSRLPG